MNTETDWTAYHKRMIELAERAITLSGRVQVALKSVSQAAPAAECCPSDAPKASRYYCELFNDLDQPTNAIEVALSSISDMLDRIQI